MIRVFKTKKIIGIMLFRLIELSIGKSKGIIHNEYKFVFGIHKFFLSLTFGKENQNAEELKKAAIQEQKDTYASA